MAASVGRAVKFSWGSGDPQPEVPGVREKGVEFSGEAIDVSADDSSGWRELLTVAGQNEVNISLSGVTKSDTLREDWINGTRTQPATIAYSNGATLTGTFYLATYNETGVYNDAVTFEAEIQSTGAVLYTPAV